MGAKHGIKNEGILIDCPTKMQPCAFCKVVFSCAPESDVGVKMVEGSSELHPPGCHSKDVCPYMRSNYQHYMAFIVHKIAGIQFISKQYNPVGGMSQGAAAKVTLTAAQQPVAAPRCYICVQECLHLQCQRCDKMSARIAQLDSYLASQTRRAEEIESQDAEAMAVEAEAAPNAAPMPMAENAAAPAETRRETRQRRRQACEHSTPKQPTQGLAQGSDGAPSNGFLGYPHTWMFDGALAQVKYHSWKCLNCKCKCTKASCAWWDVEILWHGGAEGIRVSYVNLSGDQPKQERWGDQYVDVLSLRPRNKEEESQNSVAKNLDGELKLAELVDTDSGLHQQHKQLQAPKQQQQPQPTPHQQEGELMDTPGGATEHQHEPNPEEAHATRATPKSDAATTAVPTTDRAGLPTLNNSNVSIFPSREGRIQNRLFEGGDKPQAKRAKLSKLEAKAKEKEEKEARMAKWGQGGAVSNGWMIGTTTQSTRAEPVARTAGEGSVARVAGGDRNKGESEGLDNSEGQRRVAVTEPCAQDL